MQILIEIDETRADVLERIKENAGLYSYREVFDSGLTLLDWAVKQRTAGRIVATLDRAAHSYKELAFDALTCKRQPPKKRTRPARSE
jgi:hypothetical protein